LISDCSAIDARPPTAGAFFATSQPFAAAASELLRVGAPNWTLSAALRLGFSACETRLRDDAGRTVSDLGGGGSGWGWALF
jgi:hypothetical protein